MEDKQNFLKENEATEKKRKANYQIELLHQLSDRENLLMTKRTLLRSNTALETEKKEEADLKIANKDQVSPSAANLQLRIKVNLDRSSSLLTFVRDQNKSDDMSFQDIEPYRKDGSYSIIEDIPSRVKINQNHNFKRDCDEEIIIHNQHINKDQNPYFYFNKDYKDYSFNSSMHTIKKRKILNFEIPEVEEKSMSEENDKISNIKESDFLTNEEYLKGLFSENE